jgi:hypothetical protein
MLFSIIKRNEFKDLILYSSPYLQHDNSLPLNIGRNGEELLIKLKNGKALETRLGMSLLSGYT